MINLVNDSHGVYFKLIIFSYYEKCLFMCLLRVIDVTRPVLTQDVIFIHHDDFVKLADENYLRVLASDKRWEEISKSYFYFIANKLRSMGLLIDNALAFKIAFPYKPSSDEISISDGIIYITNDKKLVYYNPEGETYKCGLCPVTLSCLLGVKSIAKEMGIKIRSDELDTAWLSVIEGVKYQVLSNLKFLKAKFELETVREVEYVKERL